MRLLLYGLFIGLDQVDPKYYPKSAVDKLGAIGGSASVALLRDTLKSYYGAHVTVVHPLSSDVYAAYAEMRTRLKPGDVLVCAYVGHGLYIETTAKTVGTFANEAVGRLKGKHDWTTAILLADYLMLAAEFNRLLGKFGPGITVLNIVDCCVSGVFSDLPLPKPLKLLPKASDKKRATISKSSDMISTDIYDANKARYDAILAKGPGTLKIAGVQLAAAPADKDIVVAPEVSPFSTAISDAIKYNTLSSYEQLAKVVKAYREDANYDPVMYAFGRAEKSLVSQPLFGNAPRLKAAATVP